MKRNILVEESKTPDGKSITLRKRDLDYTIYIDGQELMSTRQYHSEQVLAQVICKKYTRPDSQVIIGGLGFGYTLMAALETLPESSSVQVVELMECVIRWNENPELPLGAQHLENPRVKITHSDVLSVLQRTKPRSLDAIILDVDNGPEAMTTNSNQSIYSRNGLMIAKSALRPGGTLGIWSASPCKTFEKAMKATGFRLEVTKVKARANDKGPWHTLFIGVVP